ncbi:MAG TPA: hypothetical protein DCW68_02415 [Rhodospirillaceae bacterium]|nr:hypothetical protein [Rhodospirillaceae bacterium]
MEITGKLVPLPFRKVRKINRLIIEIKAGYPIITTFVRPAAIHILTYPVVIIPLAHKQSHKVTTFFLYRFLRPKKTIPDGRSRDLLLTYFFWRPATCFARLGKVPGRPVVVHSIGIAIIKPLIGLTMPFPRKEFRCIRTGDFIKGMCQL